MKKQKKFLDQKIAIVYRPDTKEALTTALKLAQWLKEKGISVYTQPHQKIKSISKPLTSEKIIDALSAVIVLGGDGTYLSAVRMLDGRQVPILGVNMGSLGFLTNIRMNDLYHAVIYTLEGKMELQPRSMLSLTVKGKGRKNLNVTLLNDITIERGSYSQMIAVDFHLEKFLVCKIKADGVVIATPTGSTAYNLAAGGPIIHPETSCLVVTPVSPHSLTSRPLIFSDDKVLTFRITAPSENAIITGDGRTICRISPDDEVSIKQHDKAHYVVHHLTQNYFDLLREKLKFGERA